jgi:AcrR family transcriptional regulator
MSSAAPERRARRGRRPAAEGADARAQILRAAADVFAEDGYDAASLRAIARRAGVDAGLIRHYFADKAELFTETISAPLRPDQLVKRVLAGPRDEVGASLVRALLTALEEPRARRRMIGLVRTALGHDFAARMLRQFLMREVLNRIAAALDVDDSALRATLVASQMVGLMVIRYGIEADPLASASIDEVVRRVGPVVQYHLTGFPAPGTAAEKDSAKTP